MEESKRNSAVLWVRKIIICTASLILLGIGCGINIVTSLGADPITVFYDGLSKATGLSVGITASILNAILVVVVFCIKRKYINVGTLIYLFVLGTFIDFGIWIYNCLGVPQLFFPRFIASLTGCLICFIGLGGYMSIDIGVDPWTALAIIISEKTSKSFRLIKVVLDIITLILGWIMGGTVGIITLFCAVVGGPVIQKSAELLDKILDKMLKFNYKK